MSPDVTRAARWALLGALLTGVASAQEGVCAAPESLVDVQVGGAGRGVTLLRQTPDGRVWLDPAALRGGEDGYVQERVTCPEGELVLLRPDLQVRLDLEAQVLTVTPNLDLLPRRSQAVTRPDVAGVGVGLPVGAVAYDLTVSRAPDGQVTAGGTVGLTGSRGPLSARLDVSAARDRDAQVGGGVRYQPTRDTYVQGVWNAQPLTGGRSGAFRGVQAETVGGGVRYLPALSVDLPLPAEVQLFSDAQLLGVWTLDAGRQRFTDIPLLGARGAVRAVVKDAAGTREVTVEYEFPAALLPPGGVRAAAEVGQLDGEPYAGGRVTFGVTPSVTLDADASVRTGDSRVRALLVTSGVRGEYVLSGGVQYTQAAPDPWVALANYRVARGAWSLGLLAQAPLNRWASGAAEATLGYAFTGGSASVGASVNGVQGWSGRASVTGRLTPQLTATLSGAAGPNVRQARLNVGFTPDSRLSVAGAVSTTGERSVNASYLFAPGRRASVSYAGGAAFASYTQSDGPVNVTVSGGTDGQLGASAQGSVVFAADRVYASAAPGTDTYVLLRTGVPNLAVYAGGQFRGRTDARGELVFSAPSGQAVAISVDVTRLPLEVGVKQAVLLVGGTADRALLVDWTENFTRQRFVDFQTAAGDDATGATLILTGGEQVDLNGFGTGLLRAAPDTLTGELVWPDGRRCPVVIAPDAEQVRCQTAP
ncbi:hypothetical protein [Deinococcus sp. JMULE3]|uniref:hypothetical protein n=1 Tax=Deinococcus sp. JMULE3 TaxID=2518341 RepID=UPI00157580D9|nr:hypothetical protein [Deinococcus sp. JMULE3]NTY02616.1 hypothetical protein [Deinococcus sp. JMULE3]